MPLASTAMTQKCEELGFNLMNSDSANHNGIAVDCHHNATPIPLPVTSVSPLPHWDMNETSHYYSNEIERAGGNSIIDSSQFKSAQNLPNHHHLREGEECKFLLCRADSGFPCSVGYIGCPYQYTRHENLTIPDDVMNAAFNLNNFEKPHGGGKCVTPCDSSARWPQMVNPSGTPTHGNIGQPFLNMNLGMPPFGPNQGCAVPFITPGKLDERFMNLGSGSNKESKSSIDMSRISTIGNSEWIFPPPTNTYHNQVGSRSFLNPGLDMNGAFSGFQNNNEEISNLAHTGDHEVLLDSRPGLFLGPQYAFQRPAAGDQNPYLRPVNRDLSFGGVKDIGIEFADLGYKNGFERCMAIPSLPFAGSQTKPCDSGQSGASGQLVPSSIGMINDQSPSELLPENSGKSSSQCFTSPPESTRGQDSSSIHGQSLVVGSLQQSNSPLEPLSTSDSGVQTENGNMTSQVSRASVISYLKRAASQPLSSTVLAQRRKTLPANPFIHSSIPTRTRWAPSVPNTSQTLSPLIHTAQSLTPQATYTSSYFPTAWTKSALSAPNITPTIHPLTQTAPFLQHYDNRISSLLPSSHAPPIPNQQLLAQSLPHQRLRAPIMPSAPRAPIIPSAPNIAPLYIKYKGSDRTPELIGHKCFLCKRDLSYAAEGPISQPSPPPAAAVLPCGHTFHEYCLQRITPDDQSKDPPCIPCALGA